MKGPNESEQIDIVSLLQQASTLVDAYRTVKLQEFGLTPLQCQTLLALASLGTTPIGRLAEQIGCPRANMTLTADRLERDGWTCRVRDREDRRVVHVDLTPKGRQLVDSLKFRWQSVSVDLIQTWTSEEIVELSTLLNKLLHSAIRPQAVS